MRGEEALLMESGKMTIYALVKHLVKLLHALTWKTVNVLSDLWNSAQRLVNKISGTPSFLYITRQRLIGLREKSKFAIRDERE